MSGDVEAMPGRKDQVEQTEESAILMSTSHLPTHITRPLLIPSPLLFRWNQLVLSAMRVVVIPRVIFRLMASAFASASPDAFVPFGTVPAAAGQATPCPAGHSVFSGRCHLFEAAACAAGYRTRLYSLAPTRLTRWVHPPKRMTTTRPSQGLVSTGLVALGLLTRSHLARLALSGPAIAGSIQAFPKDLYCLAIPDGLALKGCASHRLHRASRHSMLPSPSPKSLCQFHQTNRVNGITWGSAD